MKKIYFLLIAIFLFVTGANSQIGGYALKFDGVDDCAVANINNLALIGNDRLTMEFWFCQTEQTGVQYIAGLHTVAGGDRKRIVAYLDNGVVKVLVNPGTDDDAASLNINSGFTAGLNKWHHCAVTINNTLVELYIDGKNYASNNLIMAYTLAGTEFLYLGKNYYADSYAKIKLDEVRVWSTTRSEIEIKTNMFKEVAGADANLTAYFKMTNGAGTTASRNQTANPSDDLTLYSGVSWIASGAFAGPRQALDFDGTDDMINCGNNASLRRNGTSPLTIEAWIKPAAPQWGAIAGKFQHHTAHEGYSLEMFSDYRVAFLFGNNWSDWSSITSLSQLTPGVWSHVAVTYDGTTVKMYINGIFNTSITWTNGLTDSGTDFSIGSRMGTTVFSTFFAGQIDEVRLWSLARTDAEIKETMTRTLVGNEAGLSAYYRMDCINGSTAYDVTSNGNNGTLTNMDPATDWVSSGAFNTWIGGDNGSWATSGNWSNAAAPIASDNVGLYKWDLGNEISISGNPTVSSILFSSGATPAINSGFTATGAVLIEKNTNIGSNNISLGSTGNLSEVSGQLSATTGTISTTRNLSNISVLNVGGLGAMITTTANMGSTTITRGHAVQTGNGHNSISRYYDIAPTNNAALNAYLRINYFESEIAAIPENDLRLFKSTDGGTTWSGGSGATNPASNFVGLTGISSFSRWTLGNINSSLVIDPPVAPVATAANMVTTTSFSANWNASATATKYYLDVATDNGFTAFVAGFNNKDVGNVTTYSVTGLSEGVTYHYRVRANNAGGTSGNSNTINTITIPTAPIATAGTSITTTGFNANWNAFAGATGYYLDLATDGAFTNFVPGYNNKDVGNVTTLNITGLNPGNRYYYRLRSYNGGGTSDNSNTITVYMVPNAPVATLASNTTFTSFTANWNSSLPAIIFKTGTIKEKDYAKTDAIAQGYLLDVATDASFNNLLAGFNNKNVGNVTSFDVTGLTFGIYYYRLRAYNAGGTSVHSNTIMVTLSGTSVINVQQVLDFGNVVFASEPQIKTFEVSNTGTEVLAVNNFVFAGDNGIFEVLTPLPLALEAKKLYNVQVKLNPVRSGNRSVILHLINNSINPDVQVELKANVRIQTGAGTIEPPETDFGTTTKDSNTVFSMFRIMNNTNRIMTIIGIGIIGDTSSFSIVDDETANLKAYGYKKSANVITKANFVLPKILNPGESFEVRVRFLPQSIGVKSASLKVETLESAPIYSRLYGTAQGAPEIFLSASRLDFGEIAGGTVKTDSIIIKNSGTINLSVGTKSISGLDRNSFVIVSGSEAVNLKAGESQVVRVSAVGTLPVGLKDAEIQIISSDPIIPTKNIKLSSVIKNGLLASSVILFDTTDTDYFRDSIIAMKNHGNINVVIDSITIDGAFADDFSVVNTILPITLNPGEEKPITVRFKPKESGYRFARLVIHTSDSKVPFTFLGVTGNGIQVIKYFTAKGKVLFNGNPLIGVNMILTGDGNSTQKTDVSGNYSYVLSRLKNYIITPSLSGFTFNPPSRTFTNVLNDDDFIFEAINLMPSSIKLLEPANNKTINITYPTPSTPMIFRWNKSVDPEGIALKYNTTITGGGINKTFSNITDTLISADIIKDLINNASYSWFVETSDGINTTKSEVFTFKTSENTTDVEKGLDKPASYSLKQNYPNPFNPETVIEYSIPENSKVTLKIYNTAGREVAIMVNQTQPAGVYRIKWHPDNLPSGVYYYKITAGNFRSVKKMIYVR